MCVIIVWQQNYTCLGNYFDSLAARFNFIRYFVLHFHVIIKSRLLFFDHMDIIFSNYNISGLHTAPVSQDGLHLIFNWENKSIFKRKRCDINKAIQRNIIQRISGNEFEFKLWRKHICAFLCASFFLDPSFVDAILKKNGKLLRTYVGLMHNKDLQYGYFYRHFVKKK